MDALFRRNPVQEACYESEYQIREPQGYGRRQNPRMHEHLAEPQEKDVGESQGNAYSDIPADASPTFLRGKGHSHHRQYESGERQGKARILFNKREFDIGIPTHPLSVNETGK